MHRITVEQCTLGFSPSQRTDHISSDIQVCNMKRPAAQTLSPQVFRRPIIRIADSVHNFQRGVEGTKRLAGLDYSIRRQDQKILQRLVPNDQKVERESQPSPT